MTKLRMLLMATAALIATTAIATTAAQAKVPGLGTMPATTTSTLGANTLPAMTLKASTALLAKSSFDTMQFGFGDTLKAATTAGDKKAGDTDGANLTGVWAAVAPRTVGFYGKQVQARKSGLKDVAVINRAKHPAVEYAYMRLHSLGVGIG